MCFDWALFRDSTGSSLLNVLVGIDSATSMKIGLIAKNKLANNAVTIREVLAGIKRCGHYGALTIQTDGEPALVDLMANVAAARCTSMVLTRSPPYDSKANGRIERAVRSLEEITRVLKLDLEALACTTLSVHDVAFCWLLRHAVMALSWRQTGVDDMIAWHRLRREPYAG